MIEIEDEEDLESSTSSAVLERDAVPLPEDEVNAVDSVQISEERDRSLVGMDALKVSVEEAQVRQNTIDSFMHFLLERNLSSSELQFVGKRIWTVFEEKCKKNKFTQVFSNVLFQESEEPSRLQMEHDSPLPLPRSKDLATVEEEYNRQLFQQPKWKKCAVLQKR